MSENAAVLPATPSRSLAGSLGLAYAGLAYVLFLLTFTAFAAAITGLWAPWAGRSTSLGVALAVNAGLVLAFAVQHTIMARSRFKERWTRVIPAHLERSTFVLITSVILGGIVFFWQPVGAQLWSVTHPVAQNVLRVGFVLGYLGVVAASFQINHFHLFGLQQAWRFFRGQPQTGPVFREPWAYRRVRHPMMTAMIVMMWSSPTMSASQALMALLMTAYSLVGVLFEEKGLVQELAASYRDYQARVTYRVIPGIY